MRWRYRRCWLRAFSWCSVFRSCVASIIVMCLYHPIYMFRYYPQEGNARTTRPSRRSLSTRASVGGRGPPASSWPQVFLLAPCALFLPLNRNLKHGCVLDAPVPANTSCPTDGSAYCLSNSTGQQVTAILSVMYLSTYPDLTNMLRAKQIPLLVPSDRGCGGGSSGKCSQEDPCDPCDRDGLVVSTS